MFRIHDVLESSPASEAGISEGDIIAAIDGTPANELTLSRINELFEKPAGYELTIRRADRTMIAKLTPRTRI